MTLSSFLTVLVSVSSTVVPNVSTLEIETTDPSISTAKSDADAVVEEMSSLYVRTTLVPSVDVAADWKVGAVPVTAELLVTAVVFSDAASLP